MSEFKCPNFTRNCDFKVSCCKEVICCASCHKQQTTHDVSRQSISHIVCKTCKNECLSYEVSAKCSQCNTPFAEYACVECFVFDSSKEIFHCSECKKCKVGKRTNFIHCSKCGFCVSKEGRSTAHICFENHSDCPICLLEFKGNPQKAIMQFECGHFMHVECWQENLHTCPFCRATIVDMVPAEQTPLIPANPTPPPTRLTVGFPWEDSGIKQFVQQVVDIGCDYLIPG